MPAKALRAAITTALVTLCLVFLPSSLWAGKESVLYRFSGADGLYPYSSVLLDAKGSLYGTTYSGGLYGMGIVFRLSSTGKEKILYNFCSQPSCADGANPHAGLVQDANGNLFGTTLTGGASGSGTVFELSASGKESVLYSFCSKDNCADGANPSAGLLMDGSGNLFGTTASGGSGCIFGCGTVFEITADGVEKVLYRFAGKRDGAFPEGNLIVDLEGNLYGTTAQGGAAGGGWGTVFKVTTAGKEKVLYRFPGASGGAYPLGGLVQDSSGNLYGTTSGTCTGCSATIFQVTPAGKQKVLYTFCSKKVCPDGAVPLAGLVWDASGDLFGTTSSGGASNNGTVFEFSASGKESVIYSFAGGADGAAPYSGLVLDAKGNFYGTTSDQHGGGFGTVFKLSQ